MRITKRSQITPEAAEIIFSEALETFIENLEGETSLRTLHRRFTAALEEVCDYRAEDLDHAIFGEDEEFGADQEDEL